MVSHHPVKSGDHRHYGNANMMFLVVEGQVLVIRHALA